MPCCTWAALSVMPEVTGRAPVRVESLASFLAADPAGLAEVLRAEEAWARANVPAYPPRPDALAFRPEAAPPAERVARFLAAVRVNPSARLALYLQLPPGQAAGGRRTLAESDVTVMKTDEAARLNTFVALREGELVPVIDVIASATDEPDYGLDFGLWEDNGTPYGRSYGFGKQPFGNPAVEWSSQGPLHLGYFHEAAIVYKAAPFLVRAYPEYRIHLWRSLAAFALRTGHDYWAWRFAGWGMHYLQDLAQPYHARVLPGVGVPRMLWINTLDLVGVHGPKQDAIQLVTNRHFALENFERQWMRAIYAAPNTPDVGAEALRDTRLDRLPYADDWPRQRGLEAGQRRGRRDRCGARRLAAAALHLRSEVRLRRHRQRRRHPCRARRRRRPRARRSSGRSRPCSATSAAARAPSCAACLR